VTGDSGSPLVAGSVASASTPRKTIRCHYTGSAPGTQPSRRDTDGTPAVCLARRYEADPGFAAHYDGIRSGLATWFRHLVDADARAHGNYPDTVTWE
jgi:hypothetical protein